MTTTPTTPPAVVPASVLVPSPAKSITQYVVPLIEGIVVAIATHFGWHVSATVFAIIAPGTGTVITIVVR